MPLDPQAVAYIARLKEMGVKPASELPLDTARANFDSGTPALFGEPDEVASVEDLDAGGVPVRVFRPRGAGDGDGRGAALYLHGGGWVNGGLTSHAPVCQTLAARSGHAVVLVDYRLAPEHPYPAAIEDAWTATRWACERFSKVVVAGDSAGGQLATSAALRARDAGIELASQILIYPVTDHPGSAAAYGDAGDGTPLPGELMWWFWSQYLPDPSRAGEADCSPLRAAHLSGLPPALILTAEFDPLAAEAEAYAARLREAGVEVTLHRYDGLIHGFIRMAAVLDRTTEALDEVAAAIAAALD